MLVWVHGGGFTSGTAGSGLYRGSGLAAEHGVVVVNVNYRLGALGFLAHRALASGGPSAVPTGATTSGPNGTTAGNWALLDLIAALRWVQGHIVSFGGDPSNVTLFGESSGAMCIAALLAMPAARGLFRGAVVQSGPPYTHSVQRAEDAAVSFVHELGSSEVSREALEKVPAEELVAALSSLARRPSRPGELPQPLLPVVDGTMLPLPPLEAIASGSAAGVATIVGTNRDEMTFFALNDGTSQVIDIGLLQRRIERSAPHVAAARVVGVYEGVLARRGQPRGPRELWVAAGSDAVFRWPSLRLAAALRANDPRTFVYLFEWESPAFDGVLGATHALEIPFVFGTHADPPISQYAGSGPDADALSAAMQTSWATFARTGDPSNGLVGRWPAWDPGRRATMVFGPASYVEDSPRNDELAVWEEADPLPGSARERW